MDMRRRGSRSRLAVATIFALIPQLVVVGFAGTAEAVAQPLVEIEPAAGVANGPIVAIGSGFAAGQPIAVTNETTSATVCSTTAASDGTFSCNGLAGAAPGTVSKIGAGTSIGSYRAAGTSEIATISGGGIGDGGPSKDAHIDSVHAVASDAGGDVFFDEGNDTVRRIDASTGVITTVATGLNQASGLAVDQQGDLFIADSWNNRVREVSAVTGSITTVAGDGTQGFSGDGGPATKAELNRPEGLAVDPKGDLFIGDGNCRIREVSAATGTITTVAGSGTCGYGGDEGPATSAELRGDLGLAVDQNGDLFIADYGNNRIREVAAATGTITTIAGNGTAGYTGDNGPATQAELSSPAGLALTPSGALLIADSYNQVIRQVNLGTGFITTVAGDGSDGFSGDGGPATSAQLGYPGGVAIDQSGDFFIGEPAHVRRVDGSTGIITTLATNASGVCGGGSAEPATMAYDSGVSGVTLDSAGDVFFSEGYANVVCEVNTSTGAVSVVAGHENAGAQFGGDGGPATSADLSEPFGLAVHGNSLYIADYQNYRVRRVDLTTGIITTVAGDGTNGVTGDDGPATSAEISDPSSVAVDQQGNLYIAGRDGVREVDATTGIITSVAGTGSLWVSGVALDNSGNLFLADGQVQDVNLATSQLTTIPGASGDSIAADTSGNLFVSGQSTNLVQRVHLATGAVTTIAGTGQEGYAGDGGPATEAELYQPMTVAVDSSDDVFVGELYGGRVREVVGGPSLTITSAPVSGQVSATATLGPITVAEEDRFGNVVSAPAGGTTVTLASTSSSGVFAATAAGPPVTTVTIPAGASSTTFFYGDTTVGAAVLTTSAASYGSAGQLAAIDAVAPTKPLNVRASAGNGSATVSWDPPSSNGGSPITSYAVTASPGGASCTHSGPGGGQCVVTGLTNGTPYAFTVTAGNAVGSSPPSDPTAPVTPLGPPTQPRGVSASAGNGSVTVSWAAPSSDGGSPITAYTVTASPGEVTCTHNGPAAGQCTVTGLTNGTPYSFTVTATNAVGTSVASAPTAPVKPVNYGITISAKVKYPKVTGDSLVYYRVKGYNTASIHGNVVGAFPGDVVTLLAEPFRAKRFSKIDTPITMTSTSASYSFSVKPLAATKYKVQISTRGKVDVTSKVQPVFVGIARSQTGYHQKCTKTECTSSYTEHMFAPPAALRTESSKHIYIYVAVGYPKIPKYLRLKATAKVTRPKRVSADVYVFMVTYSVHLRPRVNANWIDTFCTKDAESRDGIGLPGHHHCGDIRVTQKVAFLYLG